MRFLVLLLIVASAWAQVSGYGEKQVGTANDAPTVLQKMTITQRLNQQLPLDVPLVDEAGSRVTLGQYFGGHPVILSLVYYRCPILCSEELRGLAAALKLVRLRPGRDFEVVVVSIDPDETPAMAAAKKQMVLKNYGHPESANGWHFLTAKQSSIDALAQATGFGYAKIPSQNGNGVEFAHASSIEIATAEGRLAQYYLGVEYSPKDLLLGLLEAGNHRIGSPVENILTYCYHYNPATNRQSLMIARVVQLGGVLTIALLGGFMGMMIRRDKRMALAARVVESAHR